jgi:hypothetical protein
MSKTTALINRVLPEQCERRIVATMPPNVLDQPRAAGSASGAFGGWGASSHLATTFAKSRSRVSLRSAT